MTATTSNAKLEAWVKEWAEIFQPDKFERLGEIRAQCGGQIGHPGETGDAFFVKPAEHLRGTILRLAARDEGGFDLGGIEALDGWLLRRVGHGTHMAHERRCAKRRVSDVLRACHASRAA